MVSQLPRPFIFIHIPKTAGTSIEKALLPIATGYRDFHEVPVWQKKKLHLPGTGQPLQHRKLGSYIKLLRTDSYFIFAVVRNPFERAVSQIAYLERSCREGNELFQGDWKTKLMTLATAKCWIAGQDLGATQSDYIQTPAAVVSNVFVARFECLDIHWRRICKRLYIDIPPELPHIFRRQNAEPYQNYYDEESREVISAKYRCDLERFSYSF